MEQPGTIMKPVVLLWLLLAAPAAAMDYAKAESWLCRPDTSGPCDTDLRWTPVSASGAGTPPVPPAARPAIDCFYVYPTVSRQPAGNADGTATEEEIWVVQQQFAKFAGVCRRFAPLYRQVTVAAIGGGARGDGELAYADVRAAWRHYLAHDNGGRGVLLFGHSQGARHIARLVREEIAGTPAQRLLVAAWPIGINLTLPEGADRGGDLGALPLCRTSADTGCAVAYVTFAADAPPGPDARFGRAPAGQAVACVNPAALLGRTTLTPIFPTNPRPAGTSAVTATFLDRRVETPAYALEGTVEARCVSADGASYLAVSSPVARVAQGFRAIEAGLPGWGLHLVDVNVALGTLLELAEAQARAFLARQAAARP
ncbi:DUF3089 domain-containing protein [Thermaurantiacus sp.]